MHHLKSQIDKLLSIADDCELISTVTADAAKQVSFRRLATQLRAMAARIKLEMLDGSTRCSDRDFLRAQAGKCRELAVSTDAELNSELLRLAHDYDREADAK